MGRWISFLIFLVFILGIGAVGGLSTASSVREWYPTLAKPSWTPPSSIFGPVWTVLYVFVAIVGWRLWRQRDNGVFRALFRLWVVQLVLNALWSPAFFWLRDPLLGLLVIVPLWLTLVVVEVKLLRADRACAWLWLPYVLWVSFAVALNTSIWSLN